MLVTKHQTIDGARWAVNGMFLPPRLNLSALLELPAAALSAQRHHPERHLAAQSLVSQSQCRISRQRA